VNATAAPVAIETIPSIVWNGETFLLPYNNLFRQLTSRERVNLRDDIQKRGVKVAIVVDVSKSPKEIIDGGNRLSIAAELDLGPEALKFDECDNLTPEQRDELAKVLNLHRRHLSKEERDTEVMRLLVLGQMNNTAIAESLRIDEASVRRAREKLEAERSASANAEPDLPKTASAPKVLDARGRRQPSERLSPEARTLRQDRILSLVDAGQHSREQICEMLDISVGTYVQDLKAARARRDAAPKSSPSPAEAARSPLPPAPPPPGEGSTPESPPTQEAPPSAPPECNAPGEPPADPRPPLETLVIRATEKGNAIAAGRILNRESARNMRKHGWLPHEIAEFLRVKIETVSDHLHEARPEQFTPPEERGDFDPAAAARHSAELSREPWVKALLQHLLRIRGAHDLGLQKIFRENFGGAKDAIKQAADILNALIEKLENYEEEGIC